MNLPNGLNFCSVPGPVLSTRGAMQDEKRQVPAPPEFIVWEETEVIVT